MKKLTIGSAVYDDFDGVYFSYQSIRLNNQDIWDDLDLLIIDNNPDSAQGKATKSFCEKTRHIRYIPYTEKKSTTVRNEIFKNAEGEFCMSIDCHVLFEPDTIKKLIKYFEDNKDSKDLFHGPMFYDVINGHDPCTHMDPIWRGHMYGTWGYDKRGNDPKNPPFEIPMHGLGIFACKTNEWLGFNDGFIGFGGEEGYIHKKYEQAGRKTWCLPFLRWLHRFDRPTGVKYPLNLHHRIKNYLIGYNELGLPFDDIINHFSKDAPNFKFDEEIKNLSSTEKLTKEINFWDKSEIEFEVPCKIKYLKYEILKSLDGHSSLDRIEFDPLIPDAVIHSCSSQSEDSVNNLLKKDGYWISHPDDQNNFPHEFIIDCGNDFEPKKITTFPKAGLEKGAVTELKIYAGLDLDNFEPISSVNVS